MQACRHFMRRKRVNDIGMSWLDYTVQGLSKQAGVSLYSRAEKKKCLAYFFKTLNDQIKWTFISTPTGLSYKYIDL